MQLISIGDVVLNLEQISVLDLDRSPNGFILHVHSDSNQPIIDINVPQQTAAALINLVPANQRFSGRDQ